MFRRESGICLDTGVVTRFLLPFVLVASVVLGAGCGNSGGHGAAPASSAAPPPATTTVPTPTSASSAAAPGALQAEANATAAGDIPDNQLFLTFRNRSARYTIKYPEGWAQTGSSGRVTFRDKNNVVRVVATPGEPPTRASVEGDLARLRGATRQGSAQALTLSGKPALKVVYSTESAPNPVTGKRVKLVVDRYYLWKPGRRAVVDLGTPEGVDNVDAYRLMIESFRWS
jgi:hypothetical protein